MTICLKAVLQQQIEGDCFANARNDSDRSIAKVDKDKFLRGCKGFDWIWRDWKSMYRCRGLLKHGKKLTANTVANDDVVGAYALAA